MEIDWEYKIVNNNCKGKMTSVFLNCVPCFHTEICTEPMDILKYVDKCISFFSFGACGCRLYFLGSIKLCVAIWLALVNEMESAGHFGWKSLNSNVWFAIFSPVALLSAKQRSLWTSAWLTEWERCIPHLSLYTLIWNGYKLWAKTKSMLDKVLRVFGLLSQHVSLGYLNLHSTKY